ncbi:hypothetical protein AHF37_06233 [Paragonimus kellicotti]|nr:hypothetical protein AHF37_06233 [Paragonimus kellicotti]
MEELWKQKENQLREKWDNQQKYKEALDFQYEANLDGSSCHRSSTLRLAKKEERSLSSKCILMPGLKLQDPVYQFTHSQVTVRLFRFSSGFAMPPQTVVESMIQVSHHTHPCECVLRDGVF